MEGRGGGGDDCARELLGRLLEVDYYSNAMRGKVVEVFMGGSEGEESAAVGGGGGYHRMAGRLAPAAKKKAVSSQDAGTSQMAKRIVGMFIAVVASLRLSLINGAMVIAVSFVVYGLEQSTTKRALQRLRKVLNGLKAGVGSLFQRKGEWPAMGGTSGYHRMAGRLGKTVVVTAAAAAATPSATPAAAATASVASWYDAGTRLG